MGRASVGEAYLVTVCVHERGPRLEPRGEVVAVLEQVLRRASRATGVCVHDRVVWVSGFRLVLEAPPGRLTPFMHEVLGRSSRELSAALDFEGVLWARYRAVPLERGGWGEPILVRPRVREVVAAGRVRRGPGAPRCRGRKAKGLALV